MEEVKKYSGQMQSNPTEESQTDYKIPQQVPQNYRINNDIQGERPVNDMQNMSGIGGISEIEYE